MDKVEINEDVMSKIVEIADKVMGDEISGNCRPFIENMIDTGWIDVGRLIVEDYNLIKKTADDVRKKDPFPKEENYDLVNNEQWGKIIEKLRLSICVDCHGPFSYAEEGYEVCSTHLDSPYEEPDMFDDEDIPDMFDDADMEDSNQPNPN